MAEVDQDLPQISAGWIVTGAADPAVSRKDHGRNFCAYGIGDIAADITIAVAATDGISLANPATAIAIAVVVNSAVETEAAVVAVAIAAKAKETTGATNAAVESKGAA